MKGTLQKLLLMGWLLSGASLLGQKAISAPAQEELLVTSGTVGRNGGRLVASQRAEAKTLNPVMAVDRPSLEVLLRMHSDLIHINRVTQRTEPALAKWWKVSPDGRTYVLYLRRGVRFSDGHPFTAEDVVFSFQAYLDEKLHSPHRDLLMIGGQPITAEKVDAYTVRFRLAQPYAAAERLFDSLAMLPRHILEKAYQEGRLAELWNLATAPDQMAGLGPYRLKKYVAGQLIILERNPYYWKADQKGNRLPYLDELIFLTLASEDAETIRFQAGETDVISRLNAENFALVAKEQQARGYELRDLGPGLEFNFLLLNMNDDTAGRLPEVQSRQKWFREVKFRQAISAALDRQGIIRLAYQGRGTPLWAMATPGNKLWLNDSVPQPPQSIARARELLQSAGFAWKVDGALVDHGGQPVQFSIIASSSNSQRVQIANMIQQDLEKLGMRISVVPLDFRSYVQRITQSHDYDAAVMGILSGDVDPTSDMNVWTSGGGTHVWNLGEKKPATAWEAEMDRLMQQQLITLRYKTRKRLYDRVQDIVAENLPVICVASPNILVGSKKGLGNFQPAIMEHYTLHNVEELYWIPK